MGFTPWPAAQLLWGKHFSLVTAKSRCSSQHCHQSHSDASSFHVLWQLIAHKKTSNNRVAHRVLQKCPVKLNFKFLSQCYQVNESQAEKSMYIIFLNYKKGTKIFWSVEKMKKYLLLLLWFLLYFQLNFHHLTQLSYIMLHNTSTWPDFS